MAVDASLACGLFAFRGIFHMYTCTPSLAGRFSRYLFCIVCILLTSALGCGGNDNLARVTGTVKLDGQPLPNAFVIFSPVSGGTTSYGRTDQAGQYEMMFNDDEKGAWIGANRVQISTGDVSARGEGSGAREKVPASYNQRSTLKVEVSSGSNVHDFELKSDAGRILQPAAE